jgi:CheY-like chemotaxis protein
VTTVLVVDDEPDVRLIARLVLGAAGFEVVEAESGEAALGTIGTGEQPDVVLLDVRMPGISGWEVLRRLRAEPGQAHLPVVVFTADLAARSEAPLELRDYELFITKPFNPDELLDIVREAIAKGDDAAQTEATRP